MQGELLGPDPLGNDERRSYILNKLSLYVAIELGMLKTVKSMIAFSVIAYKKKLSNSNTYLLI